MESDGIVRIRSLSKANPGIFYEDKLIFTISPERDNDYVVYTVVLRKK
jgi:hypothetical protein